MQTVIKEAFVITPAATRAVDDRVDYEFVGVDGEKIATVELCRIADNRLKVVAVNCLHDTQIDGMIDDSSDNFMFEGIIVYPSGRTYVTGKTLGPFISQNVAKEVF